MDQISNLYDEKRLQMQTRTKEYVDRLIKIWTKLFDDSACLENLEKLAEHTGKIFEELILESKEKENSFMKDIENLKMEAETLITQLKVNFRIEVPESMPLLVIVDELESIVTKLREQVQQRKEQIYQLLVEQNTLCDELGNTPRPLLVDPLPSLDQIEAFKQYLHQLKEERQERFDKMLVMKREVKVFLQKLEIQVENKSEERLFDPEDINLKKKNYLDLCRMHEIYGRRVQELRERIDNMRGEVENLWDRLETSPKTRKQFMRYTDYTQSAYNAFRDELIRCQNLKDQNIKKYVQQIRQEIVQWWDKTLKSEEQRKNFATFNNSCYTDDLLMLHELELEDLKRYYESNKEIFKLYENRKVLWNRMVALEAKASDPMRYNNRGGQLLKEEKDRKIIATKLPKIEQHIIQLVQRYEEREKKQFLVYGENIMDVMAREWEKKLQSKQMNSSARKKALTPQSGRTLTPARNFTSSVANMPVNTDRTKQMAMLQNKRKLNHTEKLTPKAKRSLIYAVASPVFLKPTNSANRTPFKSPLKKLRVLGTTNRRRSGRRNNEVAPRKQRSMSKTNLEDPPKIVITNATVDSFDATYDSFEKCIAPSSRSSLNANASGTSRGSKRRRLASPEVTSINQQQLSQKTLLANTSTSPCTNRSRKFSTKNLPIIL